MNETWYELRDCSTTGIIVPNWWGKTDNPITGLAVGSFVQTAQYPGICFEVMSVVQVSPGAFLNLTINGPIFTSCALCTAGTLTGCTDPTACNYNPLATINDCSCIYNDTTIKIECNNPTVCS